jgi:hypothetical protein
MPLLGATTATWHASQLPIWRYTTRSADLTPSRCIETTTLSSAFGRASLKSFLRWTKTPLPHATALWALATEILIICLIGSSEKTIIGTLPTLAELGSLTTLISATSANLEVRAGTAPKTTREEGIGIGCEIDELAIQGATIALIKIA